MNKHILVAMDWKNRSEEELKKNRDDAAAAADDAAGCIAAYYAAADAASFSAKVKYWINNYFEITGENRKDYEKVLEEIKK